jgi:hypothetical protein
MGRCERPRPLQRNYRWLMLSHSTRRITCPLNHPNRICRNAMRAMRETSSTATELLVTHALA